MPKALQAPQTYVIQDQVYARTTKQCFSFVLSFHKDREQVFISLSRQDKPTPIANEVLLDLNSISKNLYAMATNQEA